MPIAQDIIDRLRAHWLAEGVPEPMGVSEAVLLAAEERLGVRLPDDLREFYRQFGEVRRPFDHSDTYLFPVDTFLEIYRLERCFLLSDRAESVNPFGDDPEHPVDDPHLYVVVVDYYIGIHYYAVRCVPSRSTAPVGEVRLVFEGRCVTVAASFEDFLRACLDDPYSVEVV